MRFGFSLSCVMVSITQAMAQGYLPLEIGNRWEYWDCSHSFYAYTLRSTGDTLMNNGRTYKVIRSDLQSGVHYLRQEASMIYFFSQFEQQEFIRFDLARTTGDTVTINYYSGDTTVVTVLYDRQASVFGRVLRQWGFYERSVNTSSFALREVTDSLGVTFETSEGSPFDECLRGAIIDGIQYGTITNVKPSDPPRLTQPKLLQNYPNPFNPVSTIRYALPKDAWVMLKVYNLLGQEVARLVDEGQKAGYYSVEFHAGAFASGVYFYKLEAAPSDRSSAFVQVRKMAVVK